MLALRYVHRILISIGQLNLICSQDDHDPIQIWEAFMSAETQELAEFAIRLLKIVVNQAGCERLFSDLKIKQTDRRNRLGLAKLEKMTKVCRAQLTD